MSDQVISKIQQFGSSVSAKMCPRGCPNDASSQNNVHSAYPTHIILTMRALKRHVSYVYLHMCICISIQAVPPRKTMCMQLILHTSFSQCMLSHDIVPMCACACTCVLECLYNIDAGDCLEGLSQRLRQFAMSAYASGFVATERDPLTR